MAIPLALKLASVAAAGIIGGSSSAPVAMCCPVETISCVGGVASFAAATCTVGQLFVSPNVVRETLLCPPGEVAISGGFAADLTLPFKRLLAAAPLVPSGGHATGYRFERRGTNPASYKVYVTCEGG